MRILKIFGACALATLMTASLAAAQTGITGSAHDFSSGSGPGWTGSSTEICVYCHTPHNALSTSGPLWNHEESGIVSYTPYSSPTMNSSMPTSPTGSSKLCLSCHDGTVALDNYGGATTGTENMFDVAPSRALGDNLSNDHPISIDYLDGHPDVGQGGLRTPSTYTAAPLTGTIQQELLYADKVECSSCHDVHRKYGNTYLLKITNSASELCLTCHWK